MVHANFSICLVEFPQCFRDCGVPLGTLKYLLGPDHNLSLVFSLLGGFYKALYSPVGGLRCSQVFTQTSGHLTDIGRLSLDIIMFRHIVVYSYSLPSCVSLHSGSAVLSLQISHLTLLFLLSEAEMSLWKRPTLKIILSNSCLHAVSSTPAEQRKGFNQR